MLSKLPELGDSVFIVLRKQPLIFLHWYHHITVLLYSWFSYTEYTASARWFIVMNYCVHSIMYSYYALKSMGYNPSRKFAMLITACQLCQMTIGCTVNIWAAQYIQSSCFPQWSLFIYIMGLCYRMTNSCQDMPPREKKKLTWKFWQRRRHLLTALAFLGFFNVYALRVNLSVAIVAMNEPYYVSSGNNTFQQVRDFDWDSKLQGVVLSSFFYGYICTQLLGGWLGTRYGGARVYGAGVFVTALLTLFTPLVANISVYLLIMLRIVEGIFEGVTYPCIHAVWSVWAPPSERSSMASFAFSGSYFGTVIALPVSGVLANSFGWQSIFYITGLVGLAWCFVWWCYAKDKPDDDPFITDEELQYLKETLGSSTGKQIKHPWKQFLKSMPVWSIVLAHFCENWGFYTLLTQLPTFMKDTLNYDLEKAGFLSSVPYLVMTIIMQFAGHLSDWLCNKQIMSRTNVRKLFNCGAFISQTIFMSLAAYLLTPTGVVTCLVFAVGLGAFAWPAFSVNHLDIAPQHASVLMGLSNTFATLPGIVSPLISGFIVTNKSAEEWKIVFYIASTIYLIGAIFYGTFASADRQSWAINADEKESHQYKNAALELEST